MLAVLQSISLMSSSFCLILAWFHPATLAVYLFLVLLRKVPFQHSRISIPIRWASLRSFVFRNTTRASPNKNYCIHWNCRFIATAIAVITGAFAFAWIIRFAAVVATVILARTAIIVTVVVAITLIRIIAIAAIAVVTIVVATFATRKAAIVAIATVLLAMCN